MHSMWLDLGALLVISAVFVLIGSYSFKKAAL
jgi:hypothetical protein